MPRTVIPWIIFVLTIAMDMYGYSAIKHLVVHSSENTKRIANAIYWGMTAYVVLFFVLSISLNLRENSTPVTRFMLGIVLGIFVSKLFLSLMLLSQDFFRFFNWGYQRFFINPVNMDNSRRQFLEKLSLGFASIPLFAFVYGMVNTAYDYKIHRARVPIPNLPKGLQGLKIVQISDIHSGSLSDMEAIKRGIQMINDLTADLFVFTGDLVNNRSKEFPKFIELFREIKAPLGQYSILGNHDYGDYVDWDSDESKAENLKTLKKYHLDSNWDILCNEHRIIKHNGERFALIGVENWSSKGFVKHGDLKKAYRGTEDVPTKILLSHDPSHWDAEVTQDYNDISLTLSGHTHGMQFGIENKWIRFSPVQWVYRQWAGLYTKEAQHIYVNRGFGFIGYPGRVGIRPEITLLTLEKA